MDDRAHRFVTKDDASLMADYLHRVNAVNDPDDDYTWKPDRVSLHVPSACPKCCPPDETEQCETEQCEARSHIYEYQCPECRGIMEARNYTLETPLGNVELRWLRCVDCLHHMTRSDNRTLQCVVCFKVAKV
jgi:hypothetical protein